MSACEHEWEWLAGTCWFACRKCSADCQAVPEGRLAASRDAALAEAEAAVESSLWPSWWDADDPTQVAAANERRGAVARIRALRTSQVSPSVACWNCEGRGEVRAFYGRDDNHDAVTCRDCGGTGLRTTRTATARGER